MQYRRFQDDDLDRVLALFRSEGFDTYSADPGRALAAFKAPGSTCLVAHDGDLLAGFAQIQSDGQIQAHLSQILTHHSYRRQGVATELVRRTFEAAGALRMDLVSEEDAEAFYESFPHKRRAGFRIYPRG